MSSRQRFFGRPFFRRAAYYFGFGQGTPEDDPGVGMPVGSLVSLVLAVSVAIVLPDLLGLEDPGKIVASVGLVVVLSAVFALIRRRISAGSR